MITCPAVDLSSDVNVEKFVATIEGEEKDCQTEELPYGTTCKLTCKAGWIPDKTTEGYAETVECGSNTANPLTSASGEYSSKVKCIGKYISSACAYSLRLLSTEFLFVISRPFSANLTVKRQFESLSTIISGNEMLERLKAFTTR